MDMITMNFILGSMIFWICFLSCDLSFQNIISRYFIYPITVCFYAGTALIYYSYPAIQTLPFVSFLFAAILIILLPLLYKERIGAIFYVFFSTLTTMLALLSLLALLIQYGPQAYPDFAFEEYQLQFSVGILLLYLLAVLIVFHKQNKKFIRCASSGFSLLWLYPLLSFGLLLYMNTISEILLTDEVSMIYFFVILILLFSFITIYLAVPKNRMLATTAIQPAPTVVRPTESAETNQARDKNNQNSTEDLLESQKELFDEVIRHYDTLLERTQILDRHLQMMNQLLLEENLKAAKVYLDTIARSFHDVDRISVCDRPLINTLLSYYHFQCTRYQIQFDVKINLPLYMNIKESDLCVLLGCMIINAIEACAYVPAEKERFIHLDVRIRNSELQIICDNTFDGFVNIVEQSFKSRKKKKGKGIKTMQKITSRYRGTIEAEYPQKIFSIYINLPLYDYRPALT